MSGASGGTGRGKPGLELTAGARAKRLRFEKTPEVKVRYSGGVEASSSSARENLPDRVREGETYRGASVRWRAAARVSPEEGEEKESIA